MGVTLADLTGMYPTMPREEYDALTGRENLSLLKLMDKAPAVYRWAREHGRKDKDVFRTGRAVHMAVYEPDRFAEEYTIWSGGRRYGKAWDEFREARQGEILTADEHEQVLRIANAVRGDANAAPYISGGMAEVTALWEHVEPETPGFQELRFACRGRLDYLQAGAIVDLKTAKDASPGAFERAAWNYRYHVQAAWYVDAVAACTGHELPFVLIAVEKEPPYLVQPYEVPQELLKLGRETYRAWLRQLDFCRRENSWPGYAEGALLLGMPSWIGNDDENLSGLDLVVGG